MLFIRDVKHLLRKIDTDLATLRKVLASPNEFYEHLEVYDLAKPGSSRSVVNVLGRMRQFQARLYKNVLLQSVVPSIYSHGGIVGRSIKTNAAIHKNSRFAFKTDISEFFPSIHYKRIYRLFLEHFACTPDVSHFCTRICTYKYHLALGLITSPILADQILSRVDARIGSVCEAAGLLYTRFVDDITISGPFDLRESGFAKVLSEILHDDGFSVNSKKSVFGDVSEGFPITGIRIKDGNLDIRKEYADELDRQLNDAARLAHGGVFHGPYFTESQIRGRLQFVCWVNPGRRGGLIRKFNSISWARVAVAASERKLIVAKQFITKVNRQPQA